MNTGVDNECPICATVPPGKIFQCKEGHILCEPCLKKVRELAKSAISKPKCPSCAGKLDDATASRNRVMENMLDCLTFNCQRFRVGCKQILKRNEIKDHETSCVYGVGYKICEKLGYADTCDFTLSVANARDLKRHIISCRHFERILRYPAVSTTLNLKKCYQLALEDKNPCFHFLWEPSNGPVAALLVMKCTPQVFSFYFIDVSLSLSHGEKKRLTFSIPSEKAPLASWSFTAFGGVNSWGYLRDNNSRGNFEIGVPSILDLCDPEGKVKIDTRIDPW